MFFFPICLDFICLLLAVIRILSGAWKASLIDRQVVSYETIASDMFEDLLCTLFHFSYRWLTIEIDEYHCINITNCKSIFVHNNFAYRLHGYLWWINFYGIVHSHKLTCICQPVKYKLNKYLYLIHLYVVNAIPKLQKTCDLWTTGHFEDIRQITLNCAHIGGATTLMLYDQSCYKRLCVVFGASTKVFFRYNSHNQTNMAARSQLKLRSL